MLKDAKLNLPAETEIITYVSRGFEMFRGFPYFMDAIREVLARRPKCQVVVVGTDKACYGPELKGMPVDNFPFILWLVTGMFPWFFVSDSVSGSVGAVLENTYLVKKVVFRVSLLPLVKIISALLVHFFFIGVLFVMYLIYGFHPTIYNLQVVYYLFAVICLLLGFSWLTSALIVFLKDIGQVVAMGRNIGFVLF